VGALGLLVAKATVLLTAAHAGASLLSRAPATTRHRFWTALFVAVLFLPGLGAILPAVPLALPWAFSPAPAESVALRSPASDRVPLSAAGGPTLTSPSAGSRPTRADTGDRPRPSPIGPSLEQVLAATWLAGTLTGLVLLAVSLIRVRTLRRHAEVISDVAWHDATARIARHVGLRRRPDLLLGNYPGSPMAGGWWRPAIVLPITACRWNPECRDVVLTHELLHLARRDPLRLALSRLVVAVYWFHPLAWIAARRAAAAREQACDEGVVACGTRPSSYARVLLELAGTGRAPRMSPVLSMVHRTDLEGRLMAILTDARPAAGWRRVWPTAGLLVLACALAAVRPTVQAAPATPLKDARWTFSTPTTQPGVPLPAAQTTFAFSDSACQASARDSGSFTGTISISGDSIITNEIGRRGREHVILQQFGDVRICMLAENVDQDNAKPSQLLSTAGRVVLESERGGAGDRLELTRDAARTSWQVNGRERVLDAAGREWRDRMLALLDSVWDRSMLQGQVSSLRGRISSVRGEESSLLGQISSLNGEVSSMEGEISSIRGHESSLNGEISSVQGHVSSLRGEISSEQGAISSLNASGYTADSTERARIASRIADHEAAIKRIEQEIDDYDAAARVARIQRQRDDYDASTKVAAVEARIAGFDLGAKTAEVERRIRALDVDGQVALFQRQIDGLDADRRTAALDSQIDDQLRRLQAAINAIR